MAVAAGLAFCVPSAQATITTTTNDIILSISLTVTTNSEVGAFIITNRTYKTGQAKFANKNLLQLLGGGNGFATETFSNGDQIAIAYDGPWDGDVVVVDKTGTNVLFDATRNNGHTNTLAIDLMKDPGPFNGKVNEKAGGSTTYTQYNAGSFTLLDTNENINISGTGPSTFTFTQIYSSGTAFTTDPGASWSDSATFDFFGAGFNEVAAGESDVAISGTATGKGKGKGMNFLVLFLFE